MMESQRVAVWGIGRHAMNRILPAISSAKGLELYGVCSRKESSVRECTAMWNCTGWTAPREMLLDSKIDIVYVATPIGLHYEHGKLVLEAGKHLWCEKPITCRLKDTVDLLELSRRKGLSVCEGHMYLHHPQFQQLERYVSDGVLGAIKSIGCRFGIPKLEHLSFRSDPLLGGGAFLDVGCYPVSAVLGLFPDEKTYVKYASILTDSDSAIDTDGEAVVEFSNGVVANLEWRIDCSYRNEIDIWGENGSVFSDKIFSKPATYVPVFRLRDMRGVETTEHGEAGDHFLNMLQHFRSLQSDLVTTELERAKIAKRAELMHMIWTANGAQKMIKNDQ